MFSVEPGVSKIIFAELVPKLFEQGYELIDCQIHTEHLERFGAELIASSAFLKQLTQYTYGVEKTPWVE